MPAAGHSQIVQMDGTQAVVLGILLHCIQKADAALEAPLEMLAVQEHYAKCVTGRQPDLGKTEKGL